LEDIFYVFDKSILLCLDIVTFENCPGFVTYITYTKQLSENTQYMKSTNTIISIEYQSYAKFIIIDAYSGQIISYYEYLYEPMRNFYNDDDAMNLYTEQRSASHFYVFHPLQTYLKDFINCDANKEFKEFVSDDRRTPVNFLFDEESNNLISYAGIANYVKRYDV
jgi:hypothetical protein